MLKIATFTTVLTFVGLLLLNAGWISPHLSYASGGSSSDDHDDEPGYVDVPSRQLHHHATVYYDK